MSFSFCSFFSELLTQFQNFFAHLVPAGMPSGSKVLLKRSELTDSWAEIWYRPLMFACAHILVTNRDLFKSLAQTLNGAIVLHARLWFRPTCWSWFSSLILSHCLKEQALAFWYLQAIRAAFCKRDTIICTSKVGETKSPGLWTVFQGNIAKKCHSFSDSHKNSKIFAAAQLCYQSGGRVKQPIQAVSWQESDEGCWVGAHAWPVGCLSVSLSGQEWYSVFSSVESSCCWLFLLVPQAVESGVDIGKGHCGCSWRISPFPGWNFQGGKREV